MLRIRILWLLFLAWFFPFQGSFAQSPISWVGELPDQVQESSGLLILGDRLVTHNDSGNTPELFVLDSASLEVVRRVRVTNVENTDWEDLAQDEEYLYIADIGNNLGNRRDLKVLRISKEAFSRSDAVEASVIAFAYEDQAEFDGAQNSDWDAEALLAGRDSLWIFTKQWQSGGTVAYGIPKEPGQYQARRTAAYDVGGLITGASPVPGAEAFLLLGYSAQLQPFLLEVPSASPASGFPAQSRKTRLDIPFAQAEGVARDALGVTLISTESFANRLVSLPAGVFRYDPGTDPGDGPGEGEQGASGDFRELLLFQDPVTETLRFRLPVEDPILARAIFDASGRRVHFESGPGELPGQIDISSLGTAVYYLTVYLRDRRFSRPFLRF